MPACQEGPIGRELTGDEMDDKFGSSDNFCLEVKTQDLPNPQGFGGALALFDLHSGQPQFGENPLTENKN
jgi:hypothetical protein